MIVPPAPRVVADVDAVMPGREDASLLALAATVDLTDVRPPVDALVVEPTAALTARCKRWTSPTLAHAARLERELAVIVELALSRYFLVAPDIPDEAKLRGISIMARGSATSPLVVQESPWPEARGHTMMMCRRLQERACQKGKIRSACS